MASITIEKRTLASGETRYKCNVRARAEGKIIHNECKTFTTKALAEAWGKKQAREFEEDSITQRKKSTTISRLLTMYMSNNDIWSKVGRTKRYVIDMLVDCDIGNIKTNALKVSDLIQHCTDRRDGGAGPATIYHDIAYLRSVMKDAGPIFDIEANHKIFEDAVPVLIKMGLVGKSQKRTRRPSENELDKLRDGLIERMSRRKSSQAQIPYLDMLDFSLLTCMRIGEVCKITWADLNEAQKTVIVRDRKDPRKKEGNHMVVPLLGGSFDIAMKQPKVDDRIFPFDAKSVTAGFQRVRNALGIEDLRYHDLRREGASRLFEKGYSIEEVAQVTGHRNLNILWQVYTQLYPHKLHEKQL